MFSILIPDRTEPVEPAHAVGEEWIVYNCRHADWRLFGHWHREVFVTQKWFNRIMQVYQAMKLLGQDVTIADAYRKVFPEIVDSVAK